MEGKLYGYIILVTEREEAAQTSEDEYGLKRGATASSFSFERRKIKCQKNLRDRVGIQAVQN